MGKQKRKKKPGESLPAGIEWEHALSDLFVAYLLARNICYEEVLVDQFASTIAFLSMRSTSQYRNYHTGKNDWRPNLKFQFG